MRPALLHPAQLFRISLERLPTSFQTDFFGFLFFKRAEHAKRSDKCRCFVVVVEKEIFFFFQTDAQISKFYISDGGG